MEVLLEKAIDLFNNYKLDEAKVIFEEIVKLDKYNIQALLFLGKINSRTQDYGKAMNYFSKVIELDSTNDQAKTGLHLTKNILQLANSYYYENPYTDESLYET